MTGQNSSTYGRGYYGDDDPRYREPSGTPIPDDISGPSIPPPPPPPPTTTTVPAGIPAASTPTSIQQNNKTFHELLFSLFQYNKNLLKTQMEKTKEEISTLTDEIKKNQKMTSFVELLTKLNKLQEEFGDKIEDITEVEGLDHFIDNLEEVNKEMNSLAINTKLLGIGMKKTSYQQELTAAIQRKQEKESSSRMARFFDGMSAGLLNLRKLVDVDKVIEEQQKNVENAIETAVSNLSIGVGTRSTGSAGEGANPKTSEYSSDQKDLARRFIMRTSFEEGKMTETVQKFLENSEMVSEVIMKTASSSLEAASDEMKDIFTSFAAGEYEIGMNKEVFGKKLEFLVEKFQGEEYEQIQEALQESQLTGEERKKFIRDTLGYSRHVIVDEQKTKEMVTKELGASEAQAEAGEYNRKLREANSEEKKKKILEEARTRGYETTTQTTGTTKEVLTKSDIKAEELTNDLQTIQNIADQSSKTMRLSAFQQGLGDKFEIDGNKVVPIVNEEFSNLRQEASRLTDELSTLTDEREKTRKIQEIEERSEFGIRDKDVQTEAVKAVITTLDEGTVSDVQRLRTFMKINEEQETSKITARDADDTERKRIERERPEKARVEYGGDKGQIQRDPAVLKAKELQEEKDAILSDLEGDIKNKSERKVFREKMQPLVVDRSITALQFQEKARSARFAAETGLIFSTGMRQAGQRGLGIRENIKQGVIYQAASEAKYQAKASKTDFIKDKVSSMTTSALTGGIMNKLLLLVPGIGPALSIGWTVISNTFSALLSVGKFIFGMVGKVFKVLGEVLSKLLELGTKFLKGFVKYGTIALVAWVILFKTGLYKEIIPLISKVIKKVAPIVFGIMTKILEVVNESLEGLVKELNDMLSGGIYDIPRKIFEFFFGENGLFGEDSGFGALTSELGRLGSNLVQVGGVLLDALVELGKAMYDHFVDIVWPLYLKPAFSSLRDSIVEWSKTEFGAMVMNNIISPIIGGVDMLYNGMKLFYDFMLDFMNSDLVAFFLTPETAKSVKISHGRRVASRLGLSFLDQNNLTEEELLGYGDKSLSEVNDMLRKTSSVTEEAEYEDFLKRQEELDNKTRPLRKAQQEFEEYEMLQRSRSAGVETGLMMNPQAWVATEVLDWFGMGPEAIFSAGDEDLKRIVAKDIGADLGGSRANISAMEDFIETHANISNAELDKRFEDSVQYRKAEGDINDTPNLDYASTMANAREKFIITQYKTLARETTGTYRALIEERQTTTELRKLVESTAKSTGLSPKEVYTRIRNAQRGIDQGIGSIFTYEPIEGGGSASEYRRDTLAGGGHTRGVMDRHLGNLQQTYADANPEQREKIKQRITSNPQSVFAIGLDNNITFSSLGQESYNRVGAISTPDGIPTPETLKEMGYMVLPDGNIVPDQNREVDDSGKPLDLHKMVLQSIEQEGLSDDEKGRRINLARELGHEYDKSSSGVIPSPALTPQEEAAREPNTIQRFMDERLLSPGEQKEQEQFVASNVEAQANLISSVGQESRSLESAIRENTEATRQNSSVMTPKPKASGKAKTLYDMIFGNLFNPFGLTKNSGPAFGGINDESVAGVQEAVGIDTSSAAGATASPNPSPGNSNLRESVAGVQEAVGIDTSSAAGATASPNPSPSNSSLRETVAGVQGAAGINTGSAAGATASPNPSPSNSSLRETVAGVQGAVGINTSSAAGATASPNPSPGNSNLRESVAGVQEGVGINTSSAAGANEVGENQGGKTREQLLEELEEYEEDLSIAIKEGPISDNDTSKDRHERKIIFLRDRVDRARRVLDRDRARRGMAALSASPNESSGVNLRQSISGDTDVMARSLNTSKSLSTPQSSGGTNIFNIASNNVSSTQVDAKASANASLDNHGALAYSSIPQFA
jgi:hypothetical protein